MFLHTKSKLNWLLLLVLGLSGFLSSGVMCGSFDQTNSIQEATNANVAVNSISDEVDTSDWVTYTNEKYGFRLKYSKEFVVEDKNDALGTYFRSSPGQSHNIQLYIEDYDDAPDKQGEAYALLHTKAELISSKEKLATQPDLLVNDIPMSVFFSYDVPGAIFYRSAIFFTDTNDFIRLTMIINTEGVEHPSRPFDAELREWSEDLVDQLNEGRLLSAEDQRFIKLFDKIILTVEMI